jgi:hypothetical protein
MRATDSFSITPAQAAFYGAGGGLSATVLVSVPSRVVPGVRTRAFYKSRERLRPKADYEDEHPAMVTPVGALAQGQGPRNFLL